MRWFQFGLTCPGIWAGSARCDPKMILLRTSITPYIMDAMTRVSKTGLPINRPLWMDFADDPQVAPSYHTYTRDHTLDVGSRTSQDLVWYLSRLIFGFSEFGAVKMVSLRIGFGMKGTAKDLFHMRGTSWYQF